MWQTRIRIDAIWRSIHFSETEGKPVKMAVERGGKRIEMNYTPYEYEETA